MTLAPGIHFDVPSADYFGDPCEGPSLTQSIAKLLIDRSPAHAFAAHPRLSPPAEDEEDEPEKYDAAKAIGNAAHALLIGRGKSLAVANFPTWRTKDAKAFKADAMTAGTEPILEKHMAQAERMVAATMAQLRAVGWGDAFDGGAGEVVLVWQEAGLWFRTMIDWLPGNFIRPVDYKSTSLSCAPHAIPNLMANAGWDVQAAFHERGLDILDPENRGRRTFRFIAQENEPPFALTPVEIPEAVLTIGRKKVDYAVRQWRECMATGDWPAYGTEVCRPALPGWKETAWLNREIAESERPAQPARPALHSIMGG